MGRGGHRGPHQRHLPAADLVAAVPALPALLPAARGPLQGQVAHGTGERRQAGVAPHARDAHQLARLREAVSGERPACRSHPVLVSRARSSAS